MNGLPNCSGVDDLAPTASSVTPERGHDDPAAPAGVPCWRPVDRAGFEFGRRLIPIPVQRSIRTLWRENENGCARHCLEEESEPVENRTGLDEERLRSYWENGYLAPVDVLGIEETGEGVQAYMDCFKRMREEESIRLVRRERDGSGRERRVYQLRAAHREHPFFDRLIRDPRILDIVEAIIGPDIRMMLCQGFYKPPHSGAEMEWHQDDYYFRVSKENAVVSCWLTLDDATVENGCMWVLRGSHGEFLEHLPQEGKENVILHVDESKAVPIELRAGQALFHHGAAPHRTLPNTTDTHRRAIAIHYMDATAGFSGSWGHDEPKENMPILR